FELKEKKPKRSISQNNYLHLILSWYALEYGETLEYVKQEVFKKQINKDIFEYEYINKKTGEIRTEYKSTANLDTGQMTTAINRFRNYASKEAGIYLPEPKDLSELQYIENQIKNNEQYL
ncbi:hypothetical protein OX284_016965, partial [Flavobacterium sp. SUN046]|uniref:hypothetical protein n=1 Tax=Flavobacterium sp. SUN046 TaxID=3002440 RepID=UPI002DBB22D2